MGWLIYLIIVCGKISLFSWVCAIILVITIIIVLLIAAASYTAGMGFGENDKDRKRAKKFIALPKRFVPWLIIFTVLALFVPTTKECAAIYVLPKIVSATNESELPEQLETLAIEWTKQQINILTEKQNDEP